MRSMEAARRAGSHEASHARSSTKSAASLLAALDLGFVISVDLIYGLPGQTVDGWLTTIDRLIETGVDGISLYRLQITSQNRHFLARQNDGPQKDWAQFALFHVAHQLLMEKGYHKNHFAHFSRTRDRNLYYRHALGGESLLAIGPSADGVFGPLVYRHLELGAYLAGTRNDVVAMEGALNMTFRKRQLRVLEAEIMGERPLLEQIQ